MAWYLFPSTENVCWCFMFCVHVFAEQTGGVEWLIHVQYMGRKKYEPWGCVLTVFVSIFAEMIVMHHNRLPLSNHS